MIRLVAALLAAIAVLALMGAAIGDHEAGLVDIAGLLLDPQAADPLAVVVIVDFRLPRTVLALLVGASLAIAGALAQTVMRNPLAEPGILGLNSGAALAAVSTIVLLGAGAHAYLPLAGFAGALAAAGSVYLIAWRDGVSTMRLILVGIGVSALTGAAISYISIIGNVRDVQRALLWLTGSIYDASWQKAATLALWMGAPIAIALVLVRELDLLRYGDAVARSLGLSVNAMRSLFIVLCAMLSGAAISAAGIIGFVGLIAPHLARSMVGHAHRPLLPIAGLVGAVLVMAADLAGRTIIAPAQIPAGLMTAILGAPYFAYLLWGGRNEPV